ncbi:MAG TPA: hypothetical protein VHD33_03725 [Legionellaceae bacterium]|nr:hypothetical protein [Legionellaceae bacterium]
MQNLIKKIVVLLAILYMALLDVALAKVIDTDEAMRMKMLSDLGLPLPGSGIKIVPRTQLHMSEEQIALGKKAEEEMRTLGYAINPSDYPKELLNIGKQLQYRRKLQVASLSDESTELRPKIQDLKLAFKFKGVTPLKNAHSRKLQNVPSSNEITLMGAVPQGGFHKEKGGWSGVAQFFAVKNIGTCSYGVINVKVSNTAAELAAEDVTYIINKKPTIWTVEGSPNTGFIYKIEWYDNENFHELECANMKYSPDLTKSVIRLAKDIDTQSL